MFTEDARSTFSLQSDGSKTCAAEIGSSEYINNQGKEAGERKLINTAIAEGGWAGFQKIQWKNLTDYIVNG